MRAILTLLAVVALAVPVQAHHCATWTTSTTNEETIVVDLGSDALGIRYVVNDLCQDDPHDENDPDDPYDDDGPCGWSIWLYFENNGIAGLQRWDEVVDDTCHEQIEGDTFFW